PHIYTLSLHDALPISWKRILTHEGPWDPLHGVAFSFWAAYSVLMLLGLRYPLKFLPLLLLQLFYKLVWLAAVALPLWSANQLRRSEEHTSELQSLTNL